MDVSGEILQQLTGGRPELLVEGKYQVFFSYCRLSTSTSIPTDPHQANIKLTFQKQKRDGFLQI